jgi:putative DNA-invertase from lambdoid prophage Rac
MIWPLGLDQGDALAAVAKATGLTRQTIYRNRDNRAEAETALARWTA